MMRCLSVVALFVFISCKNGKHNEEKKIEPIEAHASYKSIKDSLDKNVTATKFEKTLSVKDSLEEERLSRIVMALPEIKQLMKDTSIWGKAGRRFSWMVAEPDSTHSDYIFQVGNESDIKFETLYWVYIDPKNLRVRFWDVVSDSLYTPTDFRKLNK